MIDLEHFHLQIHKGLQVGALQQNRVVNQEEGSLRIQEEGSGTRGRGREFPRRCDEKSQEGSWEAGGEDKEPRLEKQSGTCVFKKMGKLRDYPKC